MSAGGSTSTICIVPVEGAGAYLQVLSDSTQQPLSNVSVSVLPTASSCFGYPPLPGPASYTSNSTGWVSIYGLQANYYFETSLTYAGRSYNFTLPQGPMETTYATLSLPSGNLSITVCNPSFQAPNCTPYNQTGAATTTDTSIHGGSEVSDPLRASLATWNYTGPQWNFTVYIDTNSPKQGQPIQLVATLTNIASANQTVTDFVDPYINPGVYTSNGTEVWAWNPPAVTFLDETIASDQSISQNVTIPTSQLIAGQTYDIRVAPLFTTTQGNLTITMQFSVG